MLGGDATAWTRSAAITLEVNFDQETRYHGVRPLFHRALKNAPASCQWAHELVHALEPETKIASGIELIRKRELMRVLCELASHDIEPLLIKGTPLAYTHYAYPALRPRGDTDMLIHPCERREVRRILESMGYQSVNAVSGEFVSYQSTFIRSDQYDIPHTLDVHWKVSNAQVFANTLSHSELHESATRIPALGEYARAPSSAHSLLIACMHRVTHVHAPYFVDGRLRPGGNRFIWLYDVHLLINQMSPTELLEFVRLAMERRISAVCRDGLLSTERYIATRVPVWLVQALAASQFREPSASYIKASKLTHALNELRSLRGWGARAQLLKEQFFPPANYMRRKYETRRNVWLPALYLHRGYCSVRDRWKNL